MTVLHDNRLAVSALLDTTSRDLAVGTDYEELCTACLEELKALCKEAFDVPEFHVAPFDWSPDARLEAFGSSVQGTALATSDLDVRMSFEQFAVHQPARQLPYLRALAEKSKSSGKFVVLRIIDEARLPVLRLHFRERLEVDLTMGSDFDSGAQLDCMVRELLAAAVDEKATEFVRLVKGFAKAHNFVDAFGGYLNSLSWVFLAVNFLQLERALPKYCEVPTAQAWMRRGPLVCKSQLWPVRLTAGLFVRFLAFLESFSEGSYGVSLLWGQRTRRRDTSWSGGLAHPLYIENPYKENGANIAQCVKRQAWKEILATCEAARAVFTAASSKHGSAKEEAVALAAVFKLFRPSELPAGAAEGNDAAGIAVEAEPPTKKHRADDAS
eukprot:TRINITY_DN55136_c0_g1_i1.p1 TRINITY_DN55136_c0_g1~~TRINITY_DN55136_c0_g1_i1.p1  ORF type:complete len:383 (-),score=104.17 TRINITY_DN55136_c0_g1_i1:279-1427(-)